LRTCLGTEIIRTTDRRQFTAEIAETAEKKAKQDCERKHRHLDPGFRPGPKKAQKTWIPAFAGMTNAGPQRSLSKLSKKRGFRGRPVCFAPGKPWRNVPYIGRFFPQYPASTFVLEIKVGAWPACPYDGRCVWLGRRIEGNGRCLAKW